MDRSEIVQALDGLGLSKAWLAKRIGEERQSVQRWLDEEEPDEPRDASVWERMTNVLTGLGKPRPPVPAELRQLGIDLAIAVMQKDEETAQRLAPKIIRELTRPYNPDLG